MFSGNTARLPLSSNPPDSLFLIARLRSRLGRSCNSRTQRASLISRIPADDPPLWINERDEQDRRAEPAVMEAAHRIWGRVLYFVRGLRNDVSEAAEILAETVNAVSQAVRSDRRREPVRNLDSYLYHSFVRRFTRFVGREERIQYVEAAYARSDLFERRRVLMDDWAAYLSRELG